MPSAGPRWRPGCTWCAKALCFSSEEADELVALSRSGGGKIIGVTYGYAGHQLIPGPADDRRAGLLGDIRIVNMQFAHGFHAQPVEQENASTRWRVDPASSAQLVRGRPQPPIRCFPGRDHGPAAEDHPADVRQAKLRQSRAPLEDNAHVLMRYDNGGHRLTLELRRQLRFDARAKVRIIR